jgi:hypothetical protein
METTRKHTRDQKIRQRIPRSEFDNCGVEGELNKDVSKHPARWCLIFDKSRSQGIEEDLERAV